MRIVGIIIEANPFHNGHTYLIEQCKKQLKPDLLVAVCSGYFTMRGEISVLSKYDKTQILIDSGFDIVIDLPTICYLNSSKKFAENSINLLNQACITDLVFGVENCTLDQLSEIINIEESSSFHKRYLENTKILYSNKLSYAKTIEEISNNKLLSEISLLPNNTLALEYLKAIKKINPNIVPHAIKRIGSDDNQTNITDYPSGTALRKALAEHINIDDYITYSSKLFIDINKAYSNLNTLYKQIKFNDENYQDIMLVNEGIEHYIIKLLNYNLTFDENINALANKKYSKSRIRRTLLSMFLKIPNIIEENIPLRILGFSKLGEQYLNKLNNIIVNIKQVNSYYIEQEIKIAKLYSLITNSDITITEYMFPRKEK